MQKNITFFLITLLITIAALFYAVNSTKTRELAQNQNTTPVPTQQHDYWFMLHRKSKKEFLYEGIPGDISKSSLIQEYDVNVGIENDRPTPLPKLFGKEYWNIIAKTETTNDPETAPYFLTLDIPWSDKYPFGPEPYLECGGQCDWIRPGAFGLHGIAGNQNKLTDQGSSGCIRHSDEAISYLYQLLDPSQEKPIRYYIEDV